MTAPRTRSRARPHDNTDSEESRNGGQTVSQSQKVEHRPNGDTQIFKANPDTVFARVRITDGATVNMGDYSSFRRDVGLELDINLGEPTEDGTLTAEQQRKIDAAYDNASQWVSDRLDDVVEDAREFFEEVRT